MLLSKSRDNERGQILVIVAGGVITLLLLAGLVLDGGIAFLNQRDGQNGADTASMAGARLIAEHYTDPLVSYTSADIYGGIEATVAGQRLPDLGHPVHLGLPTTSNTSFATIGESTTRCSASPRAPSGSGSTSIGSRAPSWLAWPRSSPGTSTRMPSPSASSHASAPPGQLLPIALKQNTGDPYIPGQVYDLTDGKDIPGGFGYISWTGSNDPNSLATSICTPNNPAFTMRATFPGDPGKSNSSSVRACLQQWITSGQTILIPIYSTVVGPGNNAVYTIVGVAAFVMTSKAQPAVDNIQGYFVEYYPYSTVPGGGVVPTEGSTTVLLSIAQ